MNSNVSYRQLHEGFMMNHNGTSLLENILIITPAPILIYFVGLLNVYVMKVNFSFTVKQTVKFVLEFTLLVCFLILNFTLLCDYIYLTSVSLIIAYICLVKFYLKQAKKDIVTAKRQRIGRRPYFTLFRSNINLITCICILAVDFQIFPRRFAKTETYGYGLMDTGVGFFIVANGIIIKQNDNANTIQKSLVSSLPVVMLGIIRYVSLLALDYQQHVTEYGIHWNFFFTLVFVKLAGGLLIFTFPKRILFMALLMGILHQVTLSFFAEQWVLGDSSRSNFFSANREGLVSLPGYISLYLGSVILRKFLNMPIVNLVDDLRHGLNVFIWSLIFLFFTSIFYICFDVSRRLANLTYISWIMTMSLYGLSLSIFSEVALRLSLSIKNEQNELLVPSIYQAINYNALSFFLLSNVLTGIVNLIFNTFFVDQLGSLFILISYKLCTCGIMHLLYLKQIKLL